MVQLVKRKKSTRMHGRGMGTHGSGARKNKRKSGHKGGTGLAGTGKRADHKKSLVQKIFGHKYFGKQGITSTGTKRDNRDRINLADIELNLEKYGKKSKDAYDVVLKNYKILGTGTVANKLNITCYQASKTAVEKVVAAGGTVIIKEVKEIVTPLITKPEKMKKN